MINIIFLIFISLGLWAWGVLLSKGPNSKDIKDALKCLSENFSYLLIGFFKLFLLLIQDLLITDNNLIEKNHKKDEFIINKENISLDMITEREYASQVEDYYKNF